MSSRRRKRAREQDVTGRFLAGDFDDDAVDQAERFGARSKGAQQGKILRTAALRAAAEEVAADVEGLPVGQVIQVHSLFSEVQDEHGTVLLCTVRKTLTKVSGGYIVVGDRVRYRPTGASDELGRPEAVIEQVLPRQTVLTRSDSFKGQLQHPIVANAKQMLIVASVVSPAVKWGLIDRMLIAAQAGGLAPVVCLNKIDLAATDELSDAVAALDHYASIGVRTIQTSVPAGHGVGALRERLKQHVTVLAGHSGVGKSSLINAVQPSLDLRIGEVSEFTAKGRHTTTSARRYPLEVGGAVIDTPGVKVFGLWGVTRDNLEAFFPDVTSGSAPQWRVESFQRIEASLAD
jgi:ribosome biogenesis GTPase